MLDLVEQRRREIEGLCHRFGVKRLDLFGSAATKDFKPGSSDLDFLVEFADLGWKGSSDRYFGLLHGLEDMFHRKIDLVERKAVTSRGFLEFADAHRQSLYVAPIAKAS